MGYTVTLANADNTASVVLYDGSDEYPASGIKLVTGSNTPSTLTFKLAPSHPSYSRMTAFLSVDISGVPYSVVRMTYDYGTKNQSLLFVGEIVQTDYDVNGFVTVTCKDYLDQLDEMPFRLDDCGYEGDASNLATLMPLVMSYYNEHCGRTGNLPRMSGCTVVESYNSSGTQLTGRVTPSGTVTNASRLFPTVYHQYEADKVRTMLDFLKSVAESIGATVMLVCDSPNETYEIVFYAATSNTRAHVYSYGESIVSMSMWYDTRTYKNAAHVTGGTYKAYPNYSVRIDDSNYVELTLAASAVVGKSTIRAKKSSGSVTIPSGSMLCIKNATSGSYINNALWYETTDTVTVGTSGTDIPITPYVQLAVTYSSSSTNYVRVWTNDRWGWIVEETATPGDPTGTEYNDDGRYVYNVTERTRYGLRAFEFTDSNAIYGPLLSDRAVAEIARHLSMSRNIEASILAIETTHSHGTYDRNAHTMVGDVVHLTHSSIGVDEDLRVDGMTVNVDDPSQNRYTFGLAKTSSTRKLYDVDKSIGRRIYESRRT